MVARLLLPSSTPEFLHALDRPIADTGPWPASKHGRRLGRRDHDGCASRTRGSVEGNGVIGGIRGHAGDLSGYVLDEIAACRGVIDGRLGDRLGTDHAGSVDTEMQLLPSPTAAPPVFHSRPFTLAHDGKNQCCRRPDEAVPRPESDRMRDRAADPGATGRCDPGHRGQPASPIARTAGSPRSGATAT